jgi:hypothetical protein
MADKHKAQAIARDHTKETRKPLAKPADRRDDYSVPDLSPLDPDKIERALLVGRRVTQLENERGEAVRKAKTALEKLLRKCAGQCGGFRGQKEHTTNGVRTIPIGGTGKESTHVIVNTGELKNCYHPGDLQAVWNALPEILDRHVKACTALTDSVTAQRDAAMSVHRNVEVIESLLDSNVSMARKRELVEQVFGNAAMQDALVAAEATGEPGAVAKLVRDQAGDRREPPPEDAVAFVMDFFESKLQGVLMNWTTELPDDIVCYSTTGSHQLDWTISFVSRSVTPGASSNAQCTVVLDFDLLHRVIRDNDPQSLMQAYFGGQLKIKGDPMRVVSMSQVFDKARRLLGF